MWVKLSEIWILIFTSLLSTFYFFPATNRHFRSQRARRPRDDPKTLAMNALHFSPPMAAISSCNSTAVPRSTVSLNFLAVSSLPIRCPSRIFGSHTCRRSWSQTNSQSSDREADGDDDAQVEDLRVPDNWSEPSKALEVWITLFNFFKLCACCACLKIFALLVRGYGLSLADFILIHRLEVNYTW